MTAAHGNHSRYVQGCRCALCRDARRTYMADYRARKKTGTRIHRCPTCACTPAPTDTGGTTPP